MDMRTDTVMAIIRHRQDSIARATQDAAEFIMLRREILTSPVVVSLTIGLFGLFIVHKVMKMRAM